jgi:hypothetical protein
MLKNLKKFMATCFVLTLLCTMITNFTVEAAKPDDLYVPGWTVAFMEDGTSDTKGSANVDTSEKHGGNNSMKMIFSSSKGNNRYVTLKSEEIPLKGGTTYKFGFWVKFGASSRLFSVRLNWNNKHLLTDDNGIILKYEDGTTKKADWEYYEYSYTPEADANEKLLFMIEGLSSNGVWIDDTSVYECDEDGNIVSENMLANPGFEQTDVLPAIEMNYWTVSFNNASTTKATDFAVGDAEIVSDESEDGEGHSLFVKFPMISKSNRFMTIKSMPLNFDSAKKYKWEFSLKSNDCAKIGVRIGWNTDRTNITPETTEWTRYEGVCTPDGQPSGMQQLLIIVENYSPNGIWIDNVAVYECDSNGNATGPNIIPNPGFENEDILMEVENLSVDHSENNLIFSWENPDYANYTNINLFELDSDNKLVLVGSAERTENSIALSGLTDVAAKSYIIKTAYPVADTESEGINITPYFIDEVKFDLLEKAEPSAGGEFSVLKKDITSIEKGYIRANVSIANNYMGNDFAPTLLIALYDGNKLCNVQKVSNTISEGKLLNGAPAEFGVVFSVPDLEEGNYSAKVFVWDMTNLIPYLKNVPVLSEQ